MRFCVELLREQLAASRHFLPEHLAWASSWDMPELQSVADTRGVLWQRADQCMYGLVTPDEDGIDTSAKKPTGCLSSSWCILDELSLSFWEWIDVNKSSSEVSDDRSRYVGKEFNRGQVATSDLYAAASPLEALKFPVSICGTE